MQKFIVILFFFTSLLFSYSGNFVQPFDRGYQYFTINKCIYKLVLNGTSAGKMVKNWWTTPRSGYPDQLQFHVNSDYSSDFIVKNIHTYCSSGSGGSWHFDLYSDGVVSQSGNVDPATGQDLCSPFPFPNTKDNYTFVNTFLEFGDAETYAQNNNIVNYKILTPSSFGATSDDFYCTDVALYKLNDNNCKDINPPVSIQGYHLQFTFKNFDDCRNYILQYAKNQNGLCKQFSSCPLVYSYFNSNDNSADFNSSDYNISDIPYISDVNNTNSNNYIGTNNDNNYSALNIQDDNNDSINLNFVLQSLSQMSLSSHKDVKNIANKQDISNTYLSKIDNTLQKTNINIKGFSDTNHQDLTNINNNITDFKNMFNDPTQNFDFSNFTDFTNNTKTALSNFKSSFDQVLNTFSGGFSTPAITQGVDPIYTIDFHGKTLSLDLCSSFSVLRPFLILIFGVIAFIFSIKVYITAFKEI